MENDIASFYTDADAQAGTHLALRWRGRVRYTVPRDTKAQQTCWRTFRPGLLSAPLRAMAGLPSIAGAEACVEGPSFGVIRDAIGNGAGLSCCLTGAPGPWSKDTILILSADRVEAKYFVKAGRGANVAGLLANEANWLCRLREEKSISGHVPELVAHQRGEECSFLAQLPVCGEMDFKMGTPHVEFLRRLQQLTAQTIEYQDSELFRRLNDRAVGLQGLVGNRWQDRIDRALRRLEAAFSRSPILMTAAQNDFTPWNIRLGGNLAHVFDWEYAADQYLPLFDPLHFVLLPLALKRRPTAAMERRLREVLVVCHGWFGSNTCHHAEAQALAYLVNLATLYLWSVRGDGIDDPVVESYAALIDRLLGAG